MGDAIQIRCSHLGHLALPMFTPAHDTPASDLGQMARLTILLRLSQSSWKIECLLKYKKQPRKGLIEIQMLHLSLGFLGKEITELN